MQNLLSFHPFPIYQAPGATFVWRFFLGGGKANDMLAPLLGFFGGAWPDCPPPLDPPVEVSYKESVKQPLKTTAWRRMSCHGLQDLHIVPRGRAVTTDHCVENIIGKTATPATTQREESPSERNFCQTLRGPFLSGMAT